MSKIRVFLLTCRRPALLRRAVASLRAQTFTDWVCELHNDAPEDETPRRLLEELADDRIRLRHHTENWGPVAVFNHAFSGGEEPFLTLLEDDNWWEPGFLETALATLESNPRANVVWANMRLWQEQPEGTWTDTGRCIWKTAGSDSTAKTFRWPQALQCFDALHSNGAMLCRASASRSARVPPDLPFAIIEPARERLMGGDWILLPAPLGNFALTLSTARSRNRAQWAAAQTLVAGTYLAAHPAPRREIASLWRTLREQRPPSTGLLFLVALSGVRPAAILRGARPKDCFRFLAGVLRRPGEIVQIVRYRRKHRGLWFTLLAGARERFAENPGVAFEQPLLEKKLK